MMRALLGSGISGSSFANDSHKPKLVDIFGSTGSVGRSGLELVRAFPDRFKVNALVAGSNWSELLDQAVEFQPNYLGLADGDAANKLRDTLRKNISLESELVVGATELASFAGNSAAEIQLAAIGGMAGLSSVLAALRSGKRVALANKESVVVGSELLLEAIDQGGGEIVPVDSEHSALFQCLIGRQFSSIRNLILTCSGGPFLRASAEQLLEVTPAQACAHPRWSMGQKISVDSSTLMNKALEMIEAQKLFGISQDSIQVVIHPQAIVHSLVEFSDHTMMAQLSQPDMKSPIAFAFQYPENPLPGIVKRLDLATLHSLDFEPPDNQRFPALILAKETLGGEAGSCFALNLANEIAVDAFLRGKLDYSQIVPFCSRAVERYGTVKYATEQDLWSLHDQVSFELKGSIS